MSAVHQAEAASPQAHGLALTIDRVGKTFGAAPILRSVSLDVSPGQFLAIVGRSGTGKSTLLRIVGGLDAPSTGRVLFDGVAADRSAVRIMFQEPRLLPWARVIDNVAVGYHGGRRDAAGRALAAEALASVGLAARAREWPTVLSGGQKQRVALARALVSRPRLLLLDEPLGALDALTRLEMQALIARAWREQGFTAVLVTHDVAEAVRLADRIVVLDGGGVALDVPNPAPHPREERTAASIALEDAILRRLLAGS